MKLNFLATVLQSSFLKHSSRVIGLMLLFGLFFRPQVLSAAKPTTLPSGSLAPTNKVPSPATTTLPSRASAPTNKAPLAATQPTRLEIKLSRRQVTLYKGKSAIKRYRIAVGRRGWETPTGNFKVAQMFRDPAWMSPFTGVVIPGGAPGNPLGRYWIGFWTNGKNWIGFHGTPSTYSVGKAASHGCIRMYSKDIQELFKQVSIGTPVTVVR
jgi:lipoprotein-anchoring transpeptidase ErfK/SrfK